MARPAKSVKTHVSTTETKAEMAARLENEETLRGNDDKLRAPSYLNVKQKKIFKSIVNELKSSNLLGNLDIYILATCVIAIDRLQEIESLINNDIANLTNKELMSAKDKYTKDLYRCCTELSLSPASRAKLSNINVQTKQAQADPINQILNRKRGS